ncbi:transmembrane protein 234-like isoform X2 [Branchiostoma floridae]|uniref:Transmembrane protein 234-like isoform X2 n=1 Tax=Branchiostoma floridae TaxID=7739 RepID=A0A9J7KJJ0_BRAFL|nr:transmembrane protein 234-like isoform X2 [Branchiostoma floridae]
MTSLGDTFWLAVVSVFWGATNPLLKRGSVGIEKIKKDSAILQFFAELQFMVFNIKYLVPFIINQCGSVVYYLTLASADISLAVPITNSLTFLFTTLTGSLLGEKVGNRDTVLGMVLVLFGVFLCVLDKT